MPKSHMCGSINYCKRGPDNIFFCFVMRAVQTSLAQLIFDGACTSIFKETYSHLWVSWMGVLTPCPPLWIPHVSNQAKHSASCVRAQTRDPMMSRYLLLNGPFDSADTLNQPYIPCVNGWLHGISITLKITSIHIT